MILSSPIKLEARTFSLCLPYSLSHSPPPLTLLFLPLFPSLYRPLSLSHTLFFSFPFSLSFFLISLLSLSFFSHFPSLSLYLYPSPFLVHVFFLKKCYKTGNKTELTMRHSEQEIQSLLLLFWVKRARRCNSNSKLKV